jgi:hypothetical protein
LRPIDARASKPTKRRIIDSDEEEEDEEEEKQDSVRGDTQTDKDSAVDCDPVNGDEE